jgi:hypothetical protein
VGWVLIKRHKPEKLNRPKELYLFVNLPGVVSPQIRFDESRALLINVGVIEIWLRYLKYLVVQHFVKWIVPDRQELNIGMNVEALFQDVGTPRSGGDAAFYREDSEQVLAGHSRLNVRGPSEHAANPLCVFPIDDGLPGKGYDLQRLPGARIVLDFKGCIVNCGRLPAEFCALQFV